MVDRTNGELPSGGPLAGVRILDLTHHLAGPVCTMILADLGAEVLKIEPPRTGESARSGGNLRVGEWSTLFIASNRTKKSVVINLKTEAGQKVFHDLTAKADAVVENFRPGTADRIGVGYEQLRQINPRLVYTSLSAFGQQGPDRDKRGLDIVAQAMGGMMSLTGTVGGSPVPAGAPIGDVGSGVYAALATIAGLYAAKTQGVGQRIELSMLETVIALLAVRFQQFFANNEDMAPLGSGHPQSVPWQTFQASDEPFVVAINSDEFWRRFCTAIDRMDLWDDPRFATNADRVANREVLIPILQEWFIQRDRNDWISRLNEAGAPSGPINKLSQVAESPQAKALGIFATLDHPSEGLIPTVRFPATFSETPTAPVKPPPFLGDHTAETLRSVLSMDDEEIKALADQDAIQI